MIAKVFLIKPENIFRSQGLNYVRKPSVYTQQMIVVFVILTKEESQLYF